MSPEIPILPKNYLIQSRYRINRLLGKGGFGHVYEATDERVDKEIALKETLVESDKYRRAFEREAKLLAHLRHNNIPRVTDYFFEGKKQYLVMDLIEGLSLAELLRIRRRPISYEEVEPWAIEVLDALSYLHTLKPYPVIHRDIKPDNIRISKEGNVFLVDFGIAKGRVVNSSPEEYAPPSSSVKASTPGYASLEQVTGAGTDDQSDIYSLGATLYHLMTGRLPTPAPERYDKYNKGQSDPLIPAHHANPNVPVGISGVLLRAMALHSRDRIASAAEMRQALSEAVLASSSWMPEPRPQPSNTEEAEKAEVPTKVVNRIFICYRREDSAPQAFRLNDWLSNRQFVTFMDIDTIPYGVDYRWAINEELKSCSVFLVLIGKQWLTSARGGHRRLDHPNDLVRLEIANALSRGINVIPILVQDATMPSVDDLPDEIKDLSYLNALALNDIRWKQDVERLIKTLDTTLANLEALRKKEARKQAEEEQARRSAEEARRREEERQRVEHEDLRRKEAETVRLAQEREAARLRAEEEVRRREEETRRQAEAERLRQVEEEIAKRKAQEEAEASRLAAEEAERQRVAAEEARLRAERMLQEQTHHEELKEKERRLRAQKTKTSEGTRHLASEVERLPAIPMPPPQVTPPDKNYLKSEEAVKPMPFPAPAKTGSLPGFKNSRVWVGIFVAIILGATIWGILYARRIKQQSVGGSTEQTPTSPTTITGKPEQQTDKTINSESPSAPNSNPAPPEGMAYIPGGELLMGRDGGKPIEGPPHRVIVRPFFMELYEVTNRDYKIFFDAQKAIRTKPYGWTRGNIPDGAATKPVTGITWNDASAYCTSIGKRLPTEEEWEFAARGTDRRLYPWGARWRTGAANADGASNTLADVGVFKGASPYGLFDMVGNAWEWTATPLRPYPGGELPKDLPAGDLKVIRGGSFESEQEYATTTYRAGWPARGAETYNQTGFRCAKDAAK